ncbi:MAG: Ig-like domain-containing protein [Spirosomataceae bacterium]
MKKSRVLKTSVWVAILLCLNSPVLIWAQLPHLNGSVSDQYVAPSLKNTNEEGRANSRIAGSGVPALPPAKVRIAYIVPSNRTPQPNYKENLQFAIEMAQQWYRHQMVQTGFGPKTFLYETEEDSPRPKIHLVNVAETDSYLRGTGGYMLFDRTKVAAKNAGLTIDFEGEVWILIPETHLQNPTGSFIGGLALGGGGGSGKNSGVAQLGSTVIPLFSPQRLLDNTPYAGQTVPEFGPYPLVQDSSFVWFEGKTFSSVASSYLGALCHEMGHAFGLNHDARHDNNFFGGLMYNGLRGIRGTFFPTLYPTDYTRLEYGSALQLNESHYFNRIKNVNTAPSLSILTTGTVAPVDGLLNISFQASDSDSISYAHLFDQNGEVIDEIQFSREIASPVSVTATFKTPYYTAGKSNAFYVAVGDRQGNRTLSSLFTLSVLAGNQAPKPFFQILNPTSPKFGGYTRFDAGATSDPNGDSFTTEFDVNNDGIFDTPPLAAHYFDEVISQPGPYLARVRVTDSHGAFAVSSPVSGNYGNTCGVEAPTIGGFNNVCPGSSARLTAYGCYGTLVWSTGETASSITVNPGSATNYTVTCSYGCAAQTSLPFTVNMVADTLLLSSIASSGVQRAAHTVISTQQIPASNTVSYFAGKEVTLLPGFQAQTGSVFVASIKGCNELTATADNTWGGGSFTKKITVLANDRNPDGTLITDLSQVALPTLLTPPAKGTATVNPDGTIGYFSDETNGTDSFVYSVCHKNDPSVCAAATVTVNLQPYPDPLPNSGFESTVDFVNGGAFSYWLKGGWKPNQAVFSWLAGLGRNGSNCIKIYSGPASGPVQSNDVQAYQIIRLLPYTNYVLKGWIKTENVTTNANSGGVGGCLSVTTSVYSSDFPPRSTDIKGTNDWTQVMLPFNSGDGYVRISCRLGFTAGDSEGTAYFDDLRIEPL